MTTRRILGIDPGSRITGIGIIDTDGRRNQHVFSTCLRLGDASFPERLGTIFSELSRIIREYQPLEMAIESVFVSNNPASALKLGQARGAAICAGVIAGLPVAEYSPKEVKQATVGKGGADKAQVQHMVKLLLSLQGRLQVDTADALAVALCHAHASHLQHRLRSTVA
ncbi:MAG: crossover junction endodeoxyribonuclease RuvC [Pseudomonadota bacterium]|uniref:Crossover junction endodeoxyribonuclease RuvC n=1 Tax=Thiothrix fructosivorans TaxID=111770 RepID=A0A8B0SLN5_9GAMM|nr:crossover junction endodeoxyribonuclease RuvC [Thiothrix fructosivorans]MBO0612657.1 crossover junction endodeoxyribonuclease RuvC [Thiothrix fructosivorans]QTX11874.1 crossover junction endodeoxyribonuclease RuvC [Thiothrix fructosivorans]